MIYVIHIWISVLIIYFTIQITKKYSATIHYLGSCFFWQRRRRERRKMVSATLASRTDAEKWKKWNREINNRLLDVSGQYEPFKVRMNKFEKWTEIHWIGSKFVPRTRTQVNLHKYIIQSKKGESSLYITF